MKNGVCIIGMALVALTSSGLTSAQSAPSKMELLQSKLELMKISRIRNLDASKLERGLPKLHFATWLKNIVGRKATLRWELNDCGEQTGSAQDAGRDIPTCLGVEATLADGRRVIILVAVGTIRKGITGKPGVWSTVIMRGDQFFTVRSLRDLARTLKETRK